MGVYTQEPIGEEDKNLKDKLTSGDPFRIEKVQEHSPLEGEQKNEQPDFQSEKREVVQEAEKVFPDRSDQIENIMKRIDSKKEVKTSMHSEVKSDAVSLEGELDADAKVKRLVTMADTKGLVHATKVAIKIGDYYLLDKFHDQICQHPEVYNKEFGEEA